MRLSPAAGKKLVENLIWVAVLTLMFLGMGALKLHAHARVGTMAAVQPCFVTGGAGDRLALNNCRGDARVFGR